MPKSRYLSSPKERWQQFVQWLRYYGPERSSLLGRFAIQKLIVTIAVVLLRPFNWIVLPEKLYRKGKGQTSAWTWRSTEWTKRANVHISLTLWNTRIFNFVPAFMHKGKCYVCISLKWATVTYPNGISALYDETGKAVLWKQDGVYYLADTDKDYLIDEDPSLVPAQIYASYSLPFTLRDYTDAIALVLALGAFPYPSLPKKDHVYDEADTVMYGFYRRDKSRPKTPFEFGHEAWNYPEPNSISDTGEMTSCMTYAHMFQGWRQESLTPEQFDAESHTDMIALAAPVILIPVIKPKWLKDPEVAEVYQVVAKGKCRGGYVVISKKPAPPEDGKPHMIKAGEPHYYLEVGPKSENVAYSSRFEKKFFSNPAALVVNILSYTVAALAVILGLVRVGAALNECARLLFGIAFTLPWDTLHLIVLPTFGTIVGLVAIRIFALTSYSGSYKYVLTNLFGPGKTVELYRLHKWLKDRVSDIRRDLLDCSARSEIEQGLQDYAGYQSPKRLELDSDSISALYAGGLWQGRKNGEGAITAIVLSAVLLAVRSGLSVSSTYLLYFVAVFLVLTELAPSDIYGLDANLRCRRYPATSLARFIWYGISIACLVGVTLLAWQLR